MNNGGNIIEIPITLENNDGVAYRHIVKPNGQLSPLTEGDGYLIHIKDIVEMTVNHFVCVTDNKILISKQTNFKRYYS